MPVLKAAKEAYRRCVAKVAEEFVAQDKEVDYAPYQLATVALRKVAVWDSLSETLKSEIDLIDKFVIVSKSAAAFDKMQATPPEQSTEIWEFACPEEAVLALQHIVDNAKAVRAALACQGAADQCEAARGSG